MSYHRYFPPPPLSAFVNQFWWYEGNPSPSHLKERVLPTGTLEVVINLHEDRIRTYGREDTGKFESFDGSVLVGAYSEFFVIDTVSQQSIIGVHFRPGGAFPFFKLPAAELRDVHVPLELLWGARASELREHLREAPTPQAKFHLLEQTLLAQLARPLASHPAVSFALREFPRARSVSAVVEQIGLSQRRFIELFSQEVGLTPKLYWRVRRFQEALRQLDRQRECDWMELALDCGYFDQAHFIHDFQSFSGLNPTTYLARRGEHQNHVALPD